MGRRTRKELRRLHETEPLTQTTRQRFLGDTHDGATAMVRFHAQWARSPFDSDISLKLDAPGPSHLFHNEQTLLLLRRQSAAFN